MAPLAVSAPYSPMREAKGAGGLGGGRCGDWLGAIARSDAKTQRRKEDATTERRNDATWRPVNRRPPCVVASLRLSTTVLASLSTSDTPAYGGRPRASAARG